MDIYTATEEAYKRGYEAGKAEAEDKPPVTFWCGKTVLVREMPVTIRREVYSTKEEPYAEAYDAEGRYYKLRLDSIRKLDKPIEGVVVHGRTE